MVEYVLAIDSSPSMIRTAKTLNYGRTKTEFRVSDCRHLEQQPDVMNGNWDKVLVFPFEYFGNHLLTKLLVFLTLPFTGS